MSGARPANVTRWGVLWHSKNRLDGEVKTLLFREGLPALFETRAEARAWIRNHYGYIATRPDLRAEPHGWRVPQAVRVQARYVVAAPEKGSEDR